MGCVQGLSGASRAPAPAAHGTHTHPPPPCHRTPLPTSSEAQAPNPHQVIWALVSGGVQTRLWSFMGIP